jgi:hypothetical protein
MNIGSLGSKFATCGLGFSNLVQLRVFKIQNSKTRKPKVDNPKSENSDYENQRLKDLFTTLHAFRFSFSITPRYPGA